MKRKLRPGELQHADELLAWGRSFDGVARTSGAMSTKNRRIALDLIEAAKVEADQERHHGGHRHGARRELMPWEAEREADIRELIEASLRGYRSRRTGALAHVRSRLEYLRGELRAERISYGELAELQGYGEQGFILPDDVELREAAGLPEFGCSCWYGAALRHGGGTTTEIVRYDPACPEHGVETITALAKTLIDGDE